MVCMQKVFPKNKFHSLIIAVILVKQGIIYMKDSLLSIDHYNNFLM